MTRAKGPRVHFSDRSYQLWLSHLHLYHVPESQKELGSIMLHEHWINKKHNFNQYYEQHQAQISRRWQREIYCPLLDPSLVPPPFPARDRA